MWPEGTCTFFVGPALLVPFGVVLGIIGGTAGLVGISFKQNKNVPSKYATESARFFSKN